MRRLENGDPEQPQTFLSPAICYITLMNPSRMGAGPWLKGTFVRYAKRSLRPVERIVVFPNSVGVACL